MGGSLHRTLNRFEWMSAGNGSRQVRAVIQIDSSIHLVKEALPRYESVIYNWLPECVRTCRCLFQHHRYPLLGLFLHPSVHANLRELRANVLPIVASLFFLFQAIPRSALKSCTTRSNCTAAPSQLALLECVRESWFDPPGGMIARKSSL